MFITYPRTPAEIRALAEKLDAKLIQMIEDGVIKVAFNVFISAVVKIRRKEKGYLQKINQKLMSMYQGLWEKPDGRKSVVVYHPKGAMRMHGFSVVEFRWEKKDREQYKKERNAEFDKVRPKYCKHLANAHAAELIGAGISKTDIELMAKTGLAPDGYQVHHRNALDDSGNNEFSNLILMRDDQEHRAVHGYFNPSELAARELVPGEVAIVAHLLPPSDTVVYPNPAMGYISEPAPNSVFMEIIK